MKKTGLLHGLITPTQSKAALKIIIVFPGYR